MHPSIKTLWHPSNVRFITVFTDFPCKQAPTSNNISQQLFIRLCVFLFLLKIRWFLSITINYQARVCKPVIFLTTLKPAPLIILQFVTPTVFAVINFLTTTTGIYVKPQQKTLIKQNFTKLLISKIVPTTTVSFCYSNLNRYKQHISLDSVNSVISGFKSI